MKLNSVISVVMLLVYSMLTVIDIGIFDCSCTDSQQFVVLNVQTTCPPCSNATENCCPHNEQHDDENDDDDEDCCPLTYQRVVVDQLNVTQSKSHNSQTKVLTLFTLPFSNTISGVVESSAFSKNHSPPLNFLKIPVIYLYGQLRL